MRDEFHGLLNHARGWKNDMPELKTASFLQPWLQNIQKVRIILLGFKIIYSVCCRPIITRNLKFKTILRPRVPSNLVIASVLVISNLGQWKDEDVELPKYVIRRSWHLIGLYVILRVYAAVAFCGRGISESVYPYNGFYKRNWTRSTEHSNDEKLESAVFVSCFLCLRVSCDC